jgi:signal transduction histidine kinase
MSTGSLRVRLLAAAAILIVAALFLSGLALMQLFEGQIRERVVSSLENDMAQLVGRVEVLPGGQLVLPQPLADPRYQQREGRRYWQIVNRSAPADGSIPQVLSSPSARGLDLEAAADAEPSREKLIVVRRNIALGGADLSFLAAASRDELKVPLAELRNQLLIAFSVIAVVLIAAGWLQVMVGLSPLKQLRAQLSDIGRGATQRISGRFPDEVAPLVAEFNQVLDQRDASLERARRRAGDLAHGLKTPLSVLSAIARQLRKDGREKDARDIEEQADAMLRHTEQALVRARLSSGKGHGAVSLGPAVHKVVAAVSRLPGAEDLNFDIAIPAAAQAAIDPDDLTELLGNLIDNARKWARTTVRIAYDAPLLMIEDDGPGVPEADLARIGERGRRLDESKQGSGLGLSIVADIADIYGLAINYSRSGLGGLKVEIRL